MKYLKFLFLTLFFLTSIHCGGGSSQVVTIPGTMTLATGAPAGVSPLKLGILVDEEIELNTQMTVHTEETDDAVILDILDFLAEGQFTTEGPVKVMLDPEGDNSGTVFKLDENDQPLGKHHINLNFIIEINDQQLKMGDVQLGSFTEVIGLEVEVPPIEYRNGSNETSLLKMPDLKKFANVVLKRGDIGELEPLTEIPIE